MSSLLVKMFIFVVLMAIGYVLSRRGSLSGEFARMGSSLALNVFMFATIIGSAMSSVGGMSNRSLLVAIGASFVTSALCYTIGFSVTRPFAKSDTAAVSQLLISAPNMMFIGVPVVQAIYGPQAVLYLALSTLPFNILIYSYGVILLKGNKNGGFDMRELVTSPLIATVIAVLLLLFRIELPGILTELIDTMSAATMPFSMIVIGASLGAVDVKGIFSDLRIYAVSAIRLILSPILVYLVLSLFIKDRVLLGSMTVYAACPTGIVVSILAMKYDRTAIYASKGVLMTTALSMLTIPFIAYILPI